MIRRSDLLSNIFQRNQIRNPDFRQFFVQIQEDKCVRCIVGNQFATHAARTDDTNRSVRLIRIGMSDGDDRLKIRQSIRDGGTDRDGFRAHRHPSDIGFDMNTRFRRAIFCPQRSCDVMFIVSLTLPRLNPWDSEVLVRAQSISVLLKPSDEGVPSPLLRQTI